MSKPSTRQGLIDYCLRRLGYPVLEVNVDDDQIDDLIDDAIQYFQERHFDGQGKSVVSAGTTAGITTSNFILTTDASGVPKWTTTIDGGQF